MSLKFCKIVKKHLVPATKSVHDITVEPQHHYVLDNGVISHNSYIPTKIQSGGSGVLYAASIIVHMSKRMDKDGTDVVGSIIRCKLEKGRFTKEKSEVELNLKFESGLDRYYGLLPIAEKYKIIEKDGKKYKLPSGKLVWEKEINNNPETVFTKDILDELDIACKKEFCFGSTVSADKETNDTKIEE